MNSRLLLALCIAIVGCCFAEIDLEKKNFHSCVLKELKSKYELDREFYVSEISNPTDCDARLDDFEDEFYAVILEKFKSDDDNMTEYADCIIGQLKKHRVADLAMKRAIYETTTLISKRKRDNAIEAIDKAMESKVATATMSCMADSMFAVPFAMLYGGHSSENDTEAEKIEDYCVRKYMTETNLIDQNVYKLKLNPYNVDVTSADCDELVKTATDKIANSVKNEFEAKGKRLSKRAEKCLLKTMKEHKYLEFAAKVTFMGEIGLSEEALEAEKKIFISKMKEMYVDAIPCHSQ